MAIVTAAGSKDLERLYNAKHASVHDSTIKLKTSKYSKNRFLYSNFISICLK